MRVKYFFEDYVKGFFLSHKIGIGTILFLLLFFFVSAEEKVWSYGFYDELKTITAEDGDYEFGRAFFIHDANIRDNITSTLRYYDEANPSKNDLAYIINFIYKPEEGRIGIKIEVYYNPDYITDEKIKNVKDLENDMDAFYSIAYFESTDPNIRITSINNDPAPIETQII
jgi:hypothetical protein